MATEKKNAVEEKPVQVKVEPHVQPVKDQEVKIEKQVKPENDQEIKTELPVQEEKELKSEDVKVTDVTLKIKNISIKLPEDIHRKLKSKCAMDGESTGNVLKRLIDDYIRG